MTLAIPDELKKQMDEMKEVNWSEVARVAIKEKIVTWQLFQQIASKSKLTQKDADALAKKINRAASKRFLESYEARK